MTPGSCHVALEGMGPLGGRVLRASWSEPGTVVLVAARGSHSEPPLDEITELLRGPYGIGVIFPIRRDSPFEHRSNGELNLPSRRGHEFATTAGLLAQVPIEATDTERIVLDKLVRTANLLGRRVVELHSWGSASAGTEQIPGMSSDGEDLDDILIVAEAPIHPEVSFEDRAVRDLIDSLQRQSGRFRLTVVTLGRTPSAAIASLLSKGIAVLEGPVSRLDRSRANHYSHVIVTGTAVRSGVRHWIQSNLPLAQRVLFLPVLPQDSFTNLSPIITADELEGLDHVSLQIRGVVEEWCHWADSVWCTSAADAAALTGLQRSTPVRVIPIAARKEPGPPFSERSGIVIAATCGHDVVAGNEDSAIRAIQDVLPLVADPGDDLRITLITDEPSPMLRAAAARVRAGLAHSQDLDRLIRDARVVVAAHGYGSGQPAVVMRCLELGTPFVIGTFTAPTLDLGPIAGKCVFGAAADLATRTRQLVSDSGTWARAVSESRHLTESLYDPRSLDRVLASALAEIGIEARPPSVRWPERPSAPPILRSRTVDAPLRPTLTDASTGPLDPEPVGEAERYRAWVERHGPTPQLLESLKTELEHLEYRPLISILMPVYNTAPDVLAAAIDSVRSQIYERWELCIADDGSTSAATLKILDDIGLDARVKVVRLGGNSGISGATNAALAVAEGEFVTFLDHDDVLKLHALAQVVRWLNCEPSLDVVYSDEDKIDPEGQLYDPHIKPDWSPDQLMAQNYVCHLMVARRSLVETVGGLRSEFDGSQDYDLALRLTELSDRISHIPEPLYSWRAVPGSAAADANAKPYALAAAERAVRDALRRRGHTGIVDTLPWPGCFRARYDIPGSPRVSIIIPTRNGIHLLKRCIDSIVGKSTYTNYEIVVIDNQSSDGETLSYLAAFPGRVIPYPERFNYARMMNLAAGSVECDALLFLNNDTEVISPGWIEALLEHAMRPEVGAVGCRLYFGNGVPQHEGIMVGVGGGWAHNLNYNGYWIRGELTRNASAVTGACTMIRPDVFWEVGGNDERLRIAYNDVDLCLRIRQAGYQVVYTPAAELYHHESSSRGGYEHEEDGPLFGLRWHPKETGDPYYSPMFEVKRPFLIRV